MSTKKTSFWICVPLLFALVAFAVMYLSVADGEAKPVYGRFVFEESVYTDYHPSFSSSLNGSMFVVKNADNAVELVIENGETNDGVKVYQSSYDGMYYYPNALVNEDLQYVSDFNADEFLNLNSNKWENGYTADELIGEDLLCFSTSFVKILFTARDGFYAIYNNSDQSVAQIIKYKPCNYINSYKGEIAHDFESYIDDTDGIKLVAAQAFLDINGDGEYEECRIMENLAMSMMHSILEINVDGVKQTAFIQSSIRFEKDENGNVFLVNGHRMAVLTIEESDEGYILSEKQSGNTYTFVKN